MSIARRVASRFVAAKVTERIGKMAAKRPMKPEKLRELMLKLRKGAGTSLKLGQLMPVFEALGGWSFDLMLYWKPEIDFRPENRSYFSHPMRSVVEAEWQKMKDREVTSLPKSISDSDLHQKVYMDVEEISEGSNGFSFHYKAWRATKGVRIVAPGGATFEVGRTPDEFEDEYATNMRSLTGEKFSDWLKTTTYFKQLNEFLGTDPIEHEKEQKRLEQQRKYRADKNATCPVCFGMFKLTAKTKHGKDKTMPGMVLHGYKRPGTGWIEGNCFGQDWPPFELSPEGTKAWLVHMERFEKNTREYWDRLKSGEVTELHGDDAKVKDGKFIPPTKYVKSEMPAREWERVFSYALRDAETKFRQVEFECNRLRKAIANWKLEPLEWLAKPV